MSFFKEKEFDSPDVPGSGSNMTPDFLKLLELARKLAETPFKINSGYRTVKHNRTVGGSSTSSHLNGSAVDINCKNSSVRQRIIDGLILAGFERIGIAKTFVHADNDSNKPPAIWLY
jgi:hypothetical protein